jgi:hypothetical protein
MKGREMIDTVILNARRRGTQMAARARDWLVPGDAVASPVEALQKQLRGARTALEEARVEIAHATDRFYVDGHAFPQEPDANWPIERPGG